MLAILLTCLTIGGVTVEVELTDATKQVGELVELSADASTLMVDGESRRWPAAQIRRVSPRTRSDDARPSGDIVVSLTDGSQILAQQFSSDGTHATVLDAYGTACHTINRDRLQSVQLVPLAPDRFQTWDDMRQTLSDAVDQVVIRRPDKPLRSVEGVLGEFGKDGLSFQFDGDWIQVKRERVAGMIYYQSARPDGPTRCRVTTASRHELQVKSITYTEDGFQITTASDFSLTLPPKHVTTIDFASTSMVYLSDVQPERVSVAPWLSVNGLAQLEAKWFGPQLDRTLSGNPLRTRIDDTKKTYAKGLGLHSGTELVYRLAGQYRRFTAIATLDEIATPGQVQLIVLTDGQPRFQQTMTAAQAQQTIDVNLVGVNRLTIRVTAEKDTDLGDHLSLCDARIIK